MKILNVIASLGPRDGGPYKTVPELAHALARRGHSVDIYTTNFDNERDLDVPLKTPIESQGIRTVYFPVSSPRFWKFSYPLARALKRDIPSYDIVHLYSLYLYHGIVTGHYCRKYGVPYILQPHGTLDPFLRRRHFIRKWIAQLCYENRNIRGADAILFNSDEERRLALPVTGARPSLVVHLGLHLDQYRQLPAPGSFRAKHPELEGKTFLLFLSRINFKKGLDLAVDAFARLLQARKDIHLVIAGPDTEGYEKTIRQRCQKAGTMPYITFAGMLSESDKRAALVDADLFVLPSYSENFGVTILEALICGTPVLISDRVNIWRDIVDAGAGEAVPCHVGDISKAMQSLLANRDRLHHMGERGKLLVEQKFSWESVARAQEEAYQSILEMRGVNRLRPVEAVSS